MTGPGEQSLMAAATADMRGRRRMRVNVEITTSTTRFTAALGPDRVAGPRQRVAYPPTCSTLTLEVRIAGRAVKTRRSAPAWRPALRMGRACSVGTAGEMTTHSTAF